MCANEIVCEEDQKAILHRDFKVVQKFSTPPLTIVRPTHTLIFESDYTHTVVGHNTKSSTHTRLLGTTPSHTHTHILKYVQTKEENNLLSSSKNNLGKN